MLRHSTGFSRATAHLQAIQQLTAARKTPLYAAAPHKLAAEVDGVIAMLVQLADGVAPREQDILAFSDLFKLVLKRCEDFCEIDVPVEVDKGQLAFARRKLRGAEAVKFIFNEVQQLMEAGGSTVDLTTLRPLKTFSWLLSAPQQGLVRVWIGQVLSKRLQAKGNLAITSCEDTLACQIVKAVPGASSSSSAAASAADPLQQPDTKKASAGQKGKKSVPSDDGKAMVMRFFAKKKVA